MAKGERAQLLSNKRREHNSRRLCPLGSYAVRNRSTKVLTHRAERRAARSEIDEQLLDMEALTEDDVIREEREKELWNSLYCGDLYDNLYDNPYGDDKESEDNKWQ